MDGPHAGSTRFRFVTGVLAGASGMTDSPMRQYFDALWGNAVGLAGRLVLWTNPDKQTYLYEISKGGFEAFEHQARSASLKLDTYIGTCAVRADHDPRNGRGKAEDMVLMPALWADFDFKLFPNAASPQDEIITVIDKIGLEPTVVVHSGGGLHCYWAFEQPHVIKDRFSDGEEHTLGKALTRRFSQVAGVKFDVVGDITRVLRPPDTTNHKELNKVPTKRPVELMHCDSNVRYSYERLQVMLAKEVLAVHTSSPNRRLVDKWWDPKYENFVNLTKRVHREDMKILTTKLFKKEPIADVGARDNTWHALAWHLTALNENHGCGLILDDFLKLARPSWEAMADATSTLDDGFPWDKVVEHFERGIEAAAADFAKQIDPQHIREARQRNPDGLQTDLPYSTDELADFAKQGLTTRTVLLFYKRNYFVFTNGVWSTLEDDKTTLPVFFAQSVAPFSGIRTTYYDDKTGKRKYVEWKDVVENYCTRIDLVVYDYTAKRDHLVVENGKTVLIKYVRPADLQPRRHEIVDKFLRAFAGDRYDLLQRWLASASMVERPTAALYLHGPPDCGKTLLSQGVQSLYTQKVPFKTVLKSFDTILRDSAIMYVEESLPRAEDITDIFRDAITESRRVASEKFKADFEIRGYNRIVITANHPDMIQNTKQLSKDDEEAILQRVIFVEGQKAATSLLKLLAHEDRKLLAERFIAEHILHLRDTYAKEWFSHNNRLLVAGNRESAVHVQSRGLADLTVLNWFRAFAANVLYSRQGGFVNHGDPAVLMGHGVMLVQIDVMESIWSEISKDPKPPRLARILSKMSVGRVRFRKIEKQSDKSSKTIDLYYRVIDTDRLFQHEDSEMIQQRVENTPLSDRLLKILDAMSVASGDQEPMEYIRRKRETWLARYPHEDAHEA